MVGKTVQRTDTRTSHGPIRAYYGQGIKMLGKDIKEGDEITCAYINCEQDREDRQGELLFGWNFLCTCER